MTKRVVLAVMAVASLATGLLAQTPRPPEPLLSKLLRIAGLTAAPSQMRGPADNAAVGDIWIASVDRRSARALTTNGGYRSPIFVNDTPVVLALRGNSVVRLGAQGGSAIPLPDAPTHRQTGGDRCHEPRRSHCPPRRARITPGRAVVAKRKGVTAPLR